MDKNKFMRSVRLKESACQGCINCIKHCPTQAIRVHNGKAHIIDKFCIDCGRCILYCPHHAKIAVYDPLSVINNFKYTVALPAPSLYAQYNNLTNADIVLNALLKLGFDDVYEVSAAAELVSEASREYIKEHMDEAPFISSACPSVIRLIRVKFPSLISRLLPINSQGGFCGRDSPGKGYEKDRTEAGRDRDHLHLTVSLQSILRKIPPGN